MKKLTDDLKEFLREQWKRGEVNLPKAMWESRIGAYFSLVSAEPRAIRFEKMLYDRWLVPSFDGYRINHKWLEEFRNRN